MDFMTAVRTCLSKYVDFSGRARRSEYWWFALLGVIVGLVTGLLDSILGTDYGSGSSSGGVINSIASLALFLPSLAVGVRRLHDIGRSGWWILLWFVIIIGWIILIVWYCTDSKPDNQYGPNPKNAGPDGGYPPPPPAEPYGSGQYGSPYGG